MSFKIRTDASGNGQFTVDSTDVLSINTNTTVSLPTGTANGVAYLNGSKVLTSGSALTFDGTNLRTGGITFADASTQSTGGYTGFRNRIINGAMGIWQRGTSFTVAANTFTYTADRMNVVSGNSSTTVSRSTNVPTGVSQYSLQLQRTAGNTGTSSIVAAQVIESVNCYDLSGQTVTISFYAKAGANYSGGQLATTLWTGTAADQGITSIFGSWTGSAYTLANQTLTTTWTRFSFQATVPASTLEAGIVLSWTGSGTAGADDSVYITGVQLEKGSVATPFEFRQYGQELALCQRYYYQKNFRVPVLPWIGTNNYTCGHMAEHPVPMRSSPTVSALTTATISTTVGSLPINTTASQNAVNITYEPYVNYVLITNNQSGSVIFGVTGSYQANSEL